MKRIVGLAVVVAALWAAAIVAWVEVWPAAAAEPAATSAPVRYKPPRVEVAEGVAVDQAEVAAYVEQVVNDPRGWHTSFGQFRLLIVKPGYRDTNGIGQKIGRAFIGEDYAVVTADAWVRVGPRFAEMGGTLDEQRTWVVLHELGHLIGHVEHEKCPAPGRPAPIMREATYALDGCTLNVWPNP